MENKSQTSGFEALQYPVFRFLCPNLSDEEFEGMRTVVCGWLFGAGSKAAVSA